ncbi:MAG: hypothetical protein PUK59_04505 [Actinomycetaceae bacterium]|nr:hypothetical protein [Actinomycetaceae bacterium]MDY5273666.1 hypothetical protein [Arcanobacterium sp.]
MNLTELAALLGALNLAGIIASLGAWHKSSQSSAELSHNHGGSVKDAISRIEAEQKKQNEKLEKQSIMIEHQNEMAKSFGHQLGEINSNAAIQHKTFSDMATGLDARIRTLEQRHH